jgi:hypothetical protein
LKLSQIANAMSEEIRTYHALRRQIREALRRQHPEWIDADGASPICDSYDERLAEMLELFSLREDLALGN